VNKEAWKGAGWRSLGISIVASYYYCSALVTLQLFAGIMTRVSSLIARIVMMKLSRLNELKLSISRRRNNTKKIHLIANSTVESIRSKEFLSLNKT
jgi:hypothetical protein